MESEVNELGERLAAAEREIERAHACIDELSQQCRRDHHLRTLVATGIIVAALIGGAMSTTTTYAQVAGSTVRAPFKVVGAGGKTIATIEDGGVNGARGLLIYNTNGAKVAEILSGTSGNGAILARHGASGAGSGLLFEDDQPVFALKNPDGKFSIEFRRESARIVGPLSITDSDGKDIVTIHTDTVTQVKNAKAQDNTVTLPRGIDVISAQGKLVARTAADKDGNGYFLAHDSSGTGSSVGLLITKAGSQLSLTGTDGKTRATVKSDEGVVVYNTQGKPVGSLSAVKEKGFFELTDSGGKRMLEAGSTPEGKGFVLVTPWQVSNGILGNPSVLMGGRGQ